MSLVTWFLSVVIAGLFINLAAMYLKPRLDNIWGRYSDRRRLKNERQREDFEAKVQRFRGSPSGRVEAKLNLLSWSNDRAIFLSFIFYGLVLLVLGEIFELIGSEMKFVPVLLGIIGGAIGLSSVAMYIIAFGRVFHWRSIVRELAKDTEYDKDGNPPNSPVDPVVSRSQD